MSTFRELLYTILKNDAKVTTAGSLGSLLSHTSADPYGIYFISPPERPASPIITFHEIGASGRLPEIRAFNFTIWGGSFDLIERSLYNILHNKQVNFQSAVDASVKQIWWDWSGPDIFDENFKVYTKSMRFLVKSVKK